MHTVPNERIFSGSWEDITRSISSDLCMSTPFTPYTLYRHERFWHGWIVV